MVVVDMWFEVRVRFTFPVLEARAAAPLEPAAARSNV